MILLLCGVVFLFALLGALQAFNLSGWRFLNPQTSGETLVFVGVIVLVFLVLLLMLTLLFRSILKLYADQSGSALGARLRTRLVVGAALIALIPAVCMFLFSFLLMNRSIDRWFSQPTADLREDSNRVILELAQYAIGNARVEAESIASSGAIEKDPAQLQQVLGSHRITLDGALRPSTTRNATCSRISRHPPRQAPRRWSTGSMTRAAKVFCSKGRFLTFFSPQRSAATKPCFVSRDGNTRSAWPQPALAESSWSRFPCLKASARPPLISAQAWRNTINSLVPVAVSAPPLSSCCC